MRKLVISSLCAGLMSVGMACNEAEEPTANTTPEGARPSGDSQEPTPEQRFERNMNQAGENLEQMTEQKRDELAAEYREQMTTLDAKINQLEAKSDEVAEESKQEYNEQMTELRQKREQLQTRLNEFQQSSQESWMEMRDGLTQAWDELETSFDKAQAKFGDEAQENVQPQENVPAPQLPNPQLTPQPIPEETPQNQEEPQPTPAETP